MVLAWLQDPHERSHSHVCSHFRVNAMLTRDSVKKRLDSEQGISFLEFSYQLFQVSDRPSRAAHSLSASVLTLAYVY